MSDYKELVNRLVEVKGLLLEDAKGLEIRTAIPVAVNYISQATEAIEDLQAKCDSLTCPDCGGLQGEWLYRYTQKGAEKLWEDCPNCSGRGFIDE